MDLLSNMWGNEFYRKPILTGGVFVPAMILRQVFYGLVVIRLPDESPYVFTIGKIANYLINIFAILVVFSVWLHGDHNTGRIVTASNAFIFKEPLFNYSRYLSYI